MIIDRICKQCGRSFCGGPRAWYCPNCRADRQRDCNARRRANGTARPLGSMDHCVVCGGEYVVKGGNQRYCPKCAPDAIRAADRKQGMVYYRVNKERINPPRNERRHTPPRVCVVCGKEFKTTTRTITCSAECRRIHINYRARERRYRRRDR